MHLLRSFSWLLNPLSVKFIKWSNTLKQIVGKFPTICLSVFDHFSGLALKGLSYILCFSIHVVILSTHCGKLSSFTTVFSPLKHIRIGIR